MRIGAALLCTAVGVGFAQPPRTVLDGVYTEAQAARGKTAYQKQCQGCHGPNFEGTGVSQPLRTQAFLDLWREEGLNKLYEYIQSNMPVDDPGSLSPETYLDSLVYILQGNGFPTGKTELTEDQLESILLVGPKGPQPLPDDILVRIAGCLVGKGNSWTLTNATPPKRLRTADPINAEELNRSGEIPPGTASFRLRNTAENAAAMNRQRVQVKGMLSGDGSVKVVSLDRTGVRCESGN